jgi:hypothetical protein
MLSKLAKFALVATSLAPIFITLWFVEFSEEWKWSAGLNYLFLAVLLTGICWLLLFLSESKLERVDVEVVSVKTADQETIGFILAYLLPLINRTSLDFDPRILLFVAALLFVVVYTSHSYHFNPLMGFLGYHFYEITLKSNVTYVLVTKKEIKDCGNISQVVQISEYMLLEAR